MLSECAEREGVNGQRYLRLSLEDATGRITGFVWPEFRATVGSPALFAPASILATVQQFDGRTQLRVQRLDSLTLEQVNRATQLLPRHRCPARTQRSFDRLAKLEVDLPEPLDEFLRRVLLDPGIGIPFLRCRASVAHHHAYVGGLLVHSTEMLDIAAAEAQRTLPDDGWAPHLAQLGYLLHDLGKLRSVGEARRPLHALVVPHEFITLELLAPHLGWLAQRNARLATALRYVFAYLATPARARGTPGYFIAELVATLDQWSAAAYNQRNLAHLLHDHEPRSLGCGRVPRLSTGPARWSATL
ncbi:MAG: hypothetical protein ACREPL_15245 [Rhodanobacteraceae bacterium]